MKMALRVMSGRCAAETVACDFRAPTGECDSQVSVTCERRSNNRPAQCRDIACALQDVSMARVWVAMAARASLGFLLPVMTFLISSDIICAIFTLLAVGKEN